MVLEIFGTISTNGRNYERTIYNRMSTQRGRRKKMIRKRKVGAAAAEGKREAELKRKTEKNRRLGKFARQQGDNATPGDRLYRLRFSSRQIARSRIRIPESFNDALFRASRWIQESMPRRGPTTPAGARGQDGGKEGTPRSACSALAI